MLQYCTVRTAKRVLHPSIRIGSILGGSERQFKSITRLYLDSSLIFNSEEDTQIWTDLYMPRPDRMNKALSAIETMTNMNNKS